MRAESGGEIRPVRPLPGLPGYPECSFTMPLVVEMPAAAPSAAGG